MYSAYMKDAKEQSMEYIINKSTIRQKNTFFNTFSGIHSRRKSPCLFLFPVHEEVSCTRETAKSRICLERGNPVRAVTLFRRRRYG